MPSATKAPDIGSQARRIPTLPSELLMGTESQWLFTEDELLLTPSIVEGGWSPERERESRCKGVNFILQAGIMLKLPQITLATASVFLHRFYMRHSMVDIPGKLPGYHYYSMAATCLFLATKVEENCRKMKELVIACVRVAQKDPNKLVDEQDKEYWKWRDNILHSEDVLLEALCFDLSLEAPYKILFELLIQSHHEHHKKLRNAAWAFVNDSCLTMLCLLFSSRTIAASAIYAAARFIGVSFPDNPLGRPWWESAGVDIAEVRRACNYMASIYENATAKSGREGIVYQRTPEGIDDLDDQTRDPELKVQDGQDQNGSPGGLAHQPREEEGVNKRKDQVLATETYINIAPVSQNGRTEVSPRKRIKVQDGNNQQSATDVSRNDKSTGPRNSLDSQGDYAGLPFVKLQSDSVHSQGQRNSGSGLVSPKLDEGREEGEVET